MGHGVRDSCWSSTGRCRATRPLRSAAAARTGVRSADCAPSPFPPIADYAFLSNCHTDALVAPDGGIGWLCIPRFGSPSVFGTLLDRQSGYFKPAPLSEELETPIGALGSTVSGGERQRIGLAPALLADRPVLLLDEPTAHLGDATADAICAGVLRPTVGRTAVITRHRPGAFPGLPQLRLTAPDPSAVPGQRRMPVAAWADEVGRTAP